MLNKRSRSKYNAMLIKNKELREEIEELKDQNKLLERKLFTYKLKFGEKGPDKPQRRKRGIIDT